MTLNNYQITDKGVTNILKPIRITQFVFLLTGILMIVYGAFRVMVQSEAKQLPCLAKQLNYVWSVWELDKKTNMISKRLEHLRGWIQAAATLLTNIHLPNFFKGKIYQGNAKTVCVPGLNCYSCPAATGACPIGAFQAVVVPV